MPWARPRVSYRPTSPFRPDVRLLLPLLAALLTGLAATGCGGPDGRPPGPGDIVLVTIDTLRADHLGLYGYERATSPRIDAFFRDGAIFERSYSTEASTSPSVASILSGLPAPEHRVRLFYQLLPEDVTLVSDRLRGSHQTAAVVSNMVLTDEAIGMGGRFEHYDDYVATRESRRQIFERDARRTTDAALAWLATKRDPTRPLFLWVHYIDPHGPYDPPEEPVVFPPAERRPIPIERVPRYTRAEGVDDGNEYVRRYDAEIAYCDREVGRLLDGLATHLELEDTLVVLTADHGESMMEHERWFTHGYHVYDEITRVPLLLRGPGVPAGRHAQLVSGLDVAPTLLAFAGLERPSGLEGLDLREPDAWDPGRIAWSEASDKERHWYAAVQGSTKWLVATDQEGRVLGRLRYDLAADPGELTPLAIEGEPSMGALGELERLVAADPDPGGIPLEYAHGVQIGAPKVRPDVSPEELEILRQLGYADEE
jgi:arylsulfatase A-like enzyme